MTWIKRNLIFLIGGVLALGLLGWAGFYLLQNHKLREENKAKLLEEYATLERLTGMSPGPGDGKKTDNIAAAKGFQQDLLGFIDRSGKYFQRIAPIPQHTNKTPVTDDHEFASALRDAIAQMQRDAASASVLLPPRYDFSFAVIKSKITFAPGSLQPLSVQLGEIKAISDVLFAAKINSLDNIRRERVSVDDREMADYIEEHSVTNELAVLTPYEITFRSFSGELIQVLNGFATSPYGFMVKTINVEPTSGVAPMTTEAPSIPRGSAEEGMSAAPVAAAASRQVLALNELPLRVTIRLELIKRVGAPK